MPTVKKIKKAQDGTVKPTYKNLRMGVANKRIAEGNYPKDGYGASKEDSAAYRFGFSRGLKGEKEYPGEGPVQKMGRWEGQNVNKKKKTMKSGGKLKAVDSSKNPGLAKLPKPVRNKMGYQKDGGKSFPDLTGDGKVTKADILKGRGVIKNGAALKKQAAIAIAMKKAGKSPKKAMGGMKVGKCKYGCK